MATQKIPGNRLSYYQYGDDIVYNLGKNAAGYVTDWQYYPSGSQGIAIGGGINPDQFAYLPAGPSSDSTGADTSAGITYQKQQTALTQSNNASEQLQQAQTARVENANTTTPQPVETASGSDPTDYGEEVATGGRIVGAKTNAIKDPLANQFFTEPTDAEFDAVEQQFDELNREAGRAQPSFDPVDDTDLQFAREAISNEYMVTRDSEQQRMLLEQEGDFLIGNKDGEDTGAVASTNIEGTDTQAGTASPLPSQFLEKITPKSNPLAQFASYTYNVSIYLVNKAGLQNLQNGVKSVAGLPLIMQSGGAREDQLADTFGAKRSKFFSLDYYIDDIELEGVISGTSTQSIHNQHTIRFTVTEPNGLSFLENLHGAVKEYKTSLGFAAERINYAAQMYLMVIRFKGHQIDGIPETLAEMTGGDAGNDGYSEKYIPFMFTGVRFRVEDNKIVYHCEAAAPMSIYNLNSTHAAIPFNVELNGGTVGDVLTANQVTGKELPQSEREAQDASALANVKEQKATVYTGLVQALNENSKKAYGAEFANVYRIEFEEGAEFEKKKIILPGSGTNKERTPMKSSKEQPSAGNTDKIKKESRTKTIQAGTSIVQAIEQIIRGSEYVTSQQMIVVDEHTGQAKPADNSNPQPFQWFKVVMQTTPISDKVNPATNDFAYEIVYKVKRYQVGNINSAYFPPPIFRGVHKRYPYWFTGENTEVRHFQQDFNYLYFQQIATKLPGLKLPEINATHVARNFYMPRSNESSEGLDNRAGEIAASAASTLYSPGDLAQCDITINGDPDWIAQSEIFYGVNKSNNNPFEPDGSVNFNASEVYFGVEWNTPEDFNDEGLQAIKRYDTTSRDPLMNLIYRANTIKTKLSSGEFTQVLSGTLMTWTDSEYVTRTDRGFTYDAQKRLDDINKAVAERDAAAADDLFWAEQDAIQEQVNIRSAESMVAEQDRELEAWFNEDDATTDAPSPAETLYDDQRFAREGIMDQYGVTRDSEQQQMLLDQEFGEWDDEETTPTSTSPTFTPNAAAKPAASTPTQAAANPNTITQNTITKTGGDKTVTQTPTFQEFPLPEPLPPGVDPLDQFRGPIPANINVDLRGVPVGYTYIARDVDGELTQYRVYEENSAEGIAAQDPETGEWYEI